MTSLEFVSIEKEIAGQQTSSHSPVLASEEVHFPPSLQTSIHPSRSRYLASRETKENRILFGGPLQQAHNFFPQQPQLSLAPSKTLPEPQTTPKPIWAETPSRSPSSTLLPFFGGRLPY